MNLRYKNTILSLIKVFIIFLILLMGLYVRYIDLGTHFSPGDDSSVLFALINAKEDKNVDYFKLKLLQKPNDPKFLHKVLKKINEFQLLDYFTLVEKKLKISQYFAVAQASDYGPLQYILASFLTSISQNYREILFWGRFPSFLSAALGLIILIPLYLRLKGKDYFPFLILTMILVSLSWENIIYAKQSHSYSIGVLSAILLLWHLIKDISHIDFSVKKSVYRSLFLALISHMHYQIVCFIPAYYITIFIYYFSKVENKLKLIKSFLLTGILHIVLITPMYILFLQDKVKNGITYNRGNNNEFIFTLLSNNTLIEKINELVTFFIKNSLIVLQSNLAFIYEINPLFLPFTITLIILFIVGLISFFTNYELTKKSVGVFFLIITITLTILILINKVALSPTRQSLILLPYQAIIVSEGLGYLSRRFKYQIHTFMSILLSTLIIIAFFSDFQKIVFERTDPFNEKQIFKILQKHKINTVISYAPTCNFALMLFHRKHLHINHFNTVEWQRLYNPNFKRVAFISQRYPLDKKQFDYVKDLINLQPQTLNNFKYDYNDYKKSFSLEVTKPCDVDFLTSRIMTENNNGFYLNILEAN